MPDKLAQAGLTPCAAKQVAAPCVPPRLELVLECRKTYRGQFTGKEFLEKSLVSRMYPERDFHVFLLGEVVRIAGVSKYVKP